MNTSSTNTPVLTCAFGQSANTLMLVHVMLSSYNSLPPFFFGLPGNLLTILIANRPNNRHVSASVYMTAMAVVDSIILIESAWFLPVYYGKYINQDRGMQYISAVYIIFTSGMLSGLYLAAMSIDRLLAVQFPMKAQSICTRRNAIKVVMVITVPITLVNLNLFFSLFYVKEPITGVENLLLSVPGDVIGGLLSTLFQLIFGTLLPFIIIITCNLLIIVIVRNASNRRSQLQATTHAQDTAKHDTTFLTRMLIFVSLAYIVTSSPYRLYLLVTMIPEVASSFDLSDTCNFLLYNICVTVFWAIWMLNYGLNFYMYSLGGGKRYRQDVKEVLRSLLHCKKP